MLAMEITTTAKDVAPGTAAIATTMARLYGYEQEPVHWATEDSLREGGQDPLEGVSAFPAGDHWHYVTYGLTELYDDEKSFPARPGVSGWGFELTFRLARQPGDMAPAWPVAMLQRLARYVFRSSNVFRPGDHMELNGPLGGLRNTQLEAVLFTEDPQLPPIESRHGRVSFVQVFGATKDEVDAVRDWRCDGFLELTARSNRFLVTYPGRGSMLEDPAFADACRKAARRDGSSHGSSFASVVHWEPVGEGVEITVGAIAVRDLLRMLRLRVPYNRSFKLVGRKATITFVPGLGSGWKPQGSELVLSVPWDAASMMAEELEPKRGRYEWPGMPGVTLIVEPTDVRGANGELLRVIG
jgi:hypothetical protein